MNRHQSLSSATFIAALLLAGCGGGKPVESKAQAAPEGQARAATFEGQVKLGEDQITAAGIQLDRPAIGAGGALELPALIEGNPQATQVVSAAIGGRVVALRRNLGEAVKKGDTLAIIESREAAQINGEVRAAKARLSLAESNLTREQRLFDQKVSPEQDLIAARTAAAEARIAYVQSRQQVAAAGTGGDALNRLAIVAPMTGQIIARSAALGQTVAADAELFRIAELSTVALRFQLQADDAGRARIGSAVKVVAAGRNDTAKLAFLSPALDAETRLVPALALLDNHEGVWRIGEPVTVSVALDDQGGRIGVRVPTTAVQTVEGKPVVFVRTPQGFQATPVTLGDAAGERVLVKSGLKGEESIATTNSFTLKAELGKAEAAHED